MSKLDAICARLIKQTGSPASALGLPASSEQGATQPSSRTAASAAGAVVPATDCSAADAGTPRAVLPVAAVAALPPEPVVGSSSSSSSRASRRKAARPQSVASTSAAHGAATTTDAAGDEDDIDELFCSPLLPTSAASPYDYRAVTMPYPRFRAAGTAATSSPAPFGSGRRFAGGSPRRGQWSLSGRAVATASAGGVRRGGSAAAGAASHSAATFRSSPAYSARAIARPMATSPPQSVAELGRFGSGGSSSPSPPAEHELEAASSSSLRQYAEHTMSELLGLYGISSDVAADEGDDSRPSQQHHTQHPVWPAGRRGGLLPPDASGFDAGTAFLKAAAAAAAAAAVAAASGSGSSPASLADLHKAYATADSSLPLAHGSLAASTAAAAIRDDASSKGAASLMADALADKKKICDYSKYMKKYSSALECKNGQCMTMGYKEHFHCLDCSQKVLVKKEEMIRHLKWHRKREDSLQHGFMRYSPLDDCSSRFDQCVHNHKQTHYHCIQPGCDKVYVSTSDVQMHANYHRKASAIIMEGFQRFRATEDCGQPSCSFYSQRTTHFHCRRKDCEFTFKNKADMEKHKTYHQKDDVLLKDNFKKFMKYEHCRYEGCHYSKLSNHIHCIRPGCTYVLHSTSQLYAHKRKHEKHDFEQAYKKFKDKQGNAVLLPLTGADVGDQRLALTAAAMMRDHPTSNFAVGIPSASHVPVALSGLNGHSSSLGIGSGDGPVSFPGGSVPPGRASSAAAALSAASASTADDSDCADVASSAAVLNQARHASGDDLNKSLNLPAGLVPDMAAAVAAASGGSGAAAGGGSRPSSTNDAGAGVDLMGFSAPAGSAAMTGSLLGGKDELWKKYLQRFTANDPCNPRCQFLYKDHYHCSQPYCCMAFKSKEGMREHARQHDNQERISELMFEPINLDGSVGGDRVCHVTGCSLGSKPHFHCKWPNCTRAFLANENVFARLEHHREHDLARRTLTPVGPFGMGVSKDGVRRRGRPPKYLRDSIPVVPKVYSTDIAGGSSNELSGSLFKVFEAGEACPDELCVFYQQKHYHCTQPRCYHASDRIDVVTLHSRDFHTFIQILDGYEFYDSNVNCRRQHCHNNKVTKHFHCVRPKCDYSFVRHTTMVQHEKRHQMMVASPLMLPHQSGYGLAVEGGRARSAAWSTTAAVPNPAASSPLPYAESGQHQSSLIQPAPSTKLAASVASMGSEVKTEPSPIAAASSDGSPQLPLPLIPAGVGGSAVANINVSSSPKLVKATGTFFPSVAEPGGEPVAAARSVAECDRTAVCSSAAGRSGAVSGSARSQSPTHASALRHVKEEPGVTPPVTADQAMRLDAPTAAAWLPSNRTAAADVVDANRQLPLSAGLERFLPASNGKHCGRPFCKLKKRDHYHCKQCEQSFTDSAKAKIHVARHELAAATSVAAAAALACVSQLPVRGVDGSPAATVAAESNVTTASEGSALLPPPPYHAIGAGLPLDPGYAAFGARDSCNVSGCIYKAAAAAAAAAAGSGDCDIGVCLPHFHCIRDACGFAAVDASKLPPHTLWHDKLDREMGDDFKLYRAHVDCGRADCEHASRSAHFHCLKCPFICTDDKKLAVHRRHHGRVGGAAMSGGGGGGSSTDAHAAAAASPASSSLSGTQP